VADGVCSAGSARGVPGEVAGLVLLDLVPEDHDDLRPELIEEMRALRAAAGRDRQERDISAAGGADVPAPVIMAAIQGAGTSWMRRNGRSASSANATSSRLRSSPTAAERCTPIGSPPAVAPAGSAIPGAPATLLSGVNAT
jgi:hypothetical protein